ncbi:MAG: hypothetical protein ACYC23_19390 [Limisphaerales bacterium]
MIRDRLIPEIKKTFSGWEMEINSVDNPIIRFPAAQKDVGDVLVYDDGDEATVCVENISHGHFNPYDETISQEQREIAVTEDVISFLEALFADRVLLHTAPDHRMGGWTRLDLHDGPVELSPEQRYYLWSKPYEP